jgi:putative SOS response-associated peptidase YedK
MCGRFNVIDNPGLQQLLKDLGVDLALPQRINTAPTETVSLIRERDGSTSTADARWWLTPAWAQAVDQKYAMFNARSEGLVKSRAFSQPFKSLRGVVLMSSFIEWRTEAGAKQPWLISNESEALAVAALWDVWEKGDKPLLSCTLITTAAAPEFKDWHSRMPILLAADELGRWMDNSATIEPGDAIFRSELKAPLCLQRLPREISNARNKDPAAMRGQGDIVRLSAA